MAFNPMEHMMDLKGKQYLQVMWRLVWFREEHPDWSIHTEMVDHDKENHSAMFIAIIHNSEGKPVQTGYGSESVKDFRDYIEKAETKAVGRALAMLGYGTQFAPEFDEEDRIVDSPVQKPITIMKPTAKDVEKLAKEVSAKVTEEPKREPFASDKQKTMIRQLAHEKGIMAVEIYNRYGIRSIDEMTASAADKCILDLQATKKR